MNRPSKGYRFSSAKYRRTVIDIQATVEKHRAVIPSLLACHALSGCDTVAACFGVGKRKC